MCLCTGNIQPWPHARGPKAKWNHQDSSVIRVWPEVKESGAQGSAHSRGAWQGTGGRSLGLGGVAGGSEGCTPSRPPSRSERCGPRSTCVALGTPAGASLCRAQGPNTRETAACKMRQRSFHPRTVLRTLESQDGCGRSGVLSPRGPCPLPGQAQTNARFGRGLSRGIALRGALQ